MHTLIQLVHLEGETLQWRLCHYQIIVRIGAYLMCRE